MPMTGPCQLESEMFFCLLFPLTLYGFFIICVFLLSMSFSVSSCRSFSPFLFPCCAIVSPVCLVTFQSLSLLSSSYPYLFPFQFLFLSCFVCWVSFPRFIAPCNSAKMQLRIRWLFLFPCHLFVCFSSSIASLGPSLFFSSYLPSPLFVPCFSGFTTLYIPFTLSLFFALQISLSHSLPFQFLFNFLLPFCFLF